MKPNVFLALPEYGTVQSESRDSSYPVRAAPSGRFRISTCGRGGSLLANVFNQCWAAMMNDEAHDYAYFAMLHSDVAVDDGWLDTMIDEMEHGNYDVMHALCKLKDVTGTYSTCLAHGRREREWELKRRITSTESRRLPVTFGTEDVLEVFGTYGFHPPFDDLCLCPNTGCLVIRMSAAWWDYPGFTVKDRFVVTTKDRRVVVVEEGKKRPAGVLWPMVLSEDWLMGMWAWRQGLRVGGTQKVVTRHAGTVWYVSDNVHGDESDACFMQNPCPPQFE